MKKVIKKLGQIFVSINLAGKDVLSVGTLLVDDTFSRPFHIKSAIARLMQEYPGGHITVLTVMHRQKYIEKIVSDANIDTEKIDILTAKNNLLKKYQIAWSLLKLAKKNIDLIVLLSLDVTPLIASLFFINKKEVYLFNEFFQKWKISFKKIGEKSDYLSSKVFSRNLREIIKKSGSTLLCLKKIERLEEKKFMVVDNECLGLDHAESCLDDIFTKLFNPDVLLLTTPERKKIFTDRFNSIKIKEIKKRKINRYKVFFTMAGLGKERFDFLILPNLDISSFLASLFFIKKKKILLYNSFHQWWVIKLKGPGKFTKDILKSIFYKILNCAAFFYLLFFAFWLFLRRRCNIIFEKNAKEKRGNSCGI